MKASQATLDMIALNARTYFEKRGQTDILEKIRAKQKAARGTKDGALTVRELWDLWHAVTDEIRLSPDHAHFKDRERVLAHDFNFLLYPDDTNDASLTTALRAAYRNL